MISLAERRKLWWLQVVQGWRLLDASEGQKPQQKSTKVARTGSQAMILHSIEYPIPRHFPIGFPMVFLWYFWAMTIFGYYLDTQDFPKSVQFRNPSVSAEKWRSCDSSTVPWTLPFLGKRSCLEFMRGSLYPSSCKSQKMLGRGGWVFFFRLCCGQLGPTDPETSLW